MANWAKQANNGRLWYRFSVRSPLKVTSFFLLFAFDCICVCCICSTRTYLCGSVCMLLCGVLCAVLEWNSFCLWLWSLLLLILLSCCMWFWLFYVGIYQIRLQMQSNKNCSKNDPSEGPTLRAKDGSSEKRFLDPLKRYLGRPNFQYLHISAALIIYSRAISYCMTQYYASLG